jgi:hypothetical protein
LQVELLEGFNGFVRFRVFQSKQTCCLKLEKR